MEIKIDMDILKKLQEKPKYIRQIIFWTIIIFLAIVFLMIWIYSIKARLKTTNEKRVLEQLEPPKIEKKLEFPKIEIPKLNEEEIKEIEEELKKAEEKSQ